MVSSQMSIAVRKHDCRRGQRAGMRSLPRLAMILIVGYLTFFVAPSAACHPIGTYVLNSSTSGTARANPAGGISETCCGQYTGGYTGNCNCDPEGKRNLLDVTLLIDHIYLSKADLCCPEEGNTNGDSLNVINLTDVTRLIDNIYLSRAETAPCPQTPAFPPYLGQEPPGDEPVIFAAGIVSHPDYIEYSGTFAPDGKEYYFYRFSESTPATIYQCKVVGSEWTDPEPVGFSAAYPAYEPHLTFDNSSLYFAWATAPGLPGIWVTTRDSENWSEPQYAGQGMFVSSDQTGNIYITDMSSLMVNGKTYLAKVTVDNGLFTGYERLNIAAHYGSQAHPCIAPDGSYIIFDVESGHYMYVSFKQPDGTWGEAIDLTTHGFDPMAGGATISKDGKYLFFCLNRDIWWVDVQVVERLRPEN